jgi:hypothetical protein
VRIDERLEPRSSCFVLNLDDVSQDGRAVLLGKVPDRGRVIIKLAIETILSRFDGCFEGNGGVRGSNACYTLKNEPLGKCLCVK